MIYGEQVNHINECLNYDVANLLNLALELFSKNTSLEKVKCSDLAVVIF